MLALMEIVPVVETTVPSTSDAVATGGSVWGLLIYCALLFAVIYFMMIRPNKKRIDAIQKMQSEIKVGDRVIFANGLIGLVKKLDDSNLMVEIAKGVVVEALRGSIVSVVNEKAKK